MLCYFMLCYIILCYIMLSYLILSYLILSYFSSSFFSFPHQWEYYDKKDNFDHTTLSKKNIFQEYQVRNEDWKLKFFRMLAD